VRSPDHQHRALMACCLAMALARLNRAAEARTWLRRATENHPACPLLAEATATLAGTIQNEMGTPDQVKRMNKLP